MTKRNIHSLKKFQKELDRKKKAKEKMTRRQSNKDQENDDEEVIDELSKVEAPPKKFMLV
jgi:hypothetical protein